MRVDLWQRKLRLPPQHCSTLLGAAVMAGVAAGGGGGGGDGDGEGEGEAGGGPPPAEAAADAELEPEPEDAAEAAADPVDATSVRKAPTRALSPAQALGGGYQHGKQYLCEQ